MKDKYNALTKDIFLDSSYQLLINPRNKRLVHEGAHPYNVISSKMVNNPKNNYKKDTQLFYDTLEWCVLNDLTPNDTWCGTTSTYINTFNTIK